MKRISLAITASLFATIFSGCAFAYSNQKTQRSWIISIASKSKADAVKAGGIEIQRGATEAQPEVIESAASGIVKGAKKL